MAGHSDPGLRSIVFDCRDPYTLATWWAETIPGYGVRGWTDEIAEIWRRERGVERFEDAPSVVIDPVDGEGPNIWFNLVPEPKTGKNRLHVDVNVERFEDVDRLVERGATIVRPWGAVEHEPWVIMADPEGNVFCVFPLDREG